MNAGRHRRPCFLLITASLVAGLAACLAGGRPVTAAPLAAALPAAPPDSAVAALLGPQPGLFFNLVYCGSGRPQDGQSQLDAIDHEAAATRFGLTIIRRHIADYRPFARSLRRRAPNQTIAVYQHAHALYEYEDRAGVLDLHETNFLHGTDPAALMATRVDGGVLVDWTFDERMLYDVYGTISPAREFITAGYVVLRGLPGEPLSPIARLPRDVSAYTDTTAEAGSAHRYRVDVIHHQGHQLPFSHEVIVAGDAAGPVVRDYERAVAAAVDSSRYLLRVRFAVDAPAASARLLVDRNADRDFDDLDESVPFEPTGDGRLEAVTALDAAARAKDNLHRIIGFAYRIEIETPAGERVVLPSRGSFTTSVNNRIRNRRHGFYVMWPDTGPWVDHLERQLRQEIGRTGSVDAVFLDELIIDPSRAADADPVELTTAGFRSAAVRLVASLAERRPDLELLYNGAGEGVDPPAAAGGMLEGFCVASWYRGGREEGDAPSGIWASQIQAALTAAAAQRTMLLLARDRPLSDHRARLFSLASFHLVRGEGTRFCYRTRPCGTPVLPEWEVRLGRPLETFRQLDASLASADRPLLHRRRFEHGEVWVNADRAVTRTVDIDPPAHVVELADSPDSEVGTLVISRRVDRVELAPQSGVILLRPQEP